MTLRGAPQRRADEPGRGPFRVHRQDREAVADGEPGVLGGLVAGEQRVAGGARAHEAGNADGDRDAVAGRLDPQALGEPDRGVLRGDVGQQVRGGQLPADRRDDKGCGRGGPVGRAARNGSGARRPTT